MRELSRVSAPYDSQTRPVSAERTVETEQESDGRWTAEIPQIPGAVSYGGTRDEAISRVEGLGLRVLAERILPTVAAFVTSEIP